MGRWSYSAASHPVRSFHEASFGTRAFIICSYQSLIIGCHSTSLAAGWIWWTSKGGFLERWFWVGHYSTNTLGDACTDKKAIYFQLLPFLGGEAEQRVPSEYIVQRNSVANPPMFFYFIDRQLANSEFTSANKDYLRRAYPRLKLWYNWLNQSQSGQLPFTYRWRGRNDTTGSLTVDAFSVFC